MTVDSFSNFNVIVHPLVLLSVVDHYHRVLGHSMPIAASGASHRHQRVVGVLLGQVSPLTQQVNVSNSFAGKHFPSIS